ncbi:MAG: beta-lactamase family protein [Clostridia bacterium]|nr:beta-lactamase family protein [Clostridia bacterium]
MLGTAGKAVKRLAPLALILALLTVPLGGLCELDEETAAAADAYFLRLFTRSEAIGGGVIVSRDGETLYEYYYGADAKYNGRPVDGDTVFKVASLTKMITAVGVMRLVEEGKIGLDAPLTYGAEGAHIRNPRYPDAPVTLRQAMNHTSSLLGDAPYATAPAWEKITLDQNRYFDKYEPGTHYEYANLNGGIMGSAIERASGQSLNAYMRDAVFAPLGINAAYAAHLLPDPEPLSRTYTQEGEVYMKAEKYLEEDQAFYEDTCDPDSHYRTSVGSLYISLSGMAKIGEVLACGGAADGVRLLSPQAAAEMRADQRTVRGSTVTGESPYGLGVYRFTASDGRTWYGHQGRWVGMLTDLFVEPDSRTAVALVMNGVGRSGSGELDAKAERILLRVGEWLDGGTEIDGPGSFVVDEDLP